MEEKITVPVIGFVGLKGSGKSSCAIYLRDNFPCVIRGFAFRLKLMLERLKFNFFDLQDRDFRNLPQPRLQGKTIRYAMQTLGAEWGRDTMGKDFWVDLWREDANYYNTANTTLVDDVRFLNEAKVIKEMGGVLVRIVNLGLDSNDQHISETEQNQIKADLIIENNSTLEGLFVDLHNKLREDGVVVSSE